MKRAVVKEHNYLYITLYYIMKENHTTSLTVYFHQRLFIFCRVFMKTSSLTAVKVLWVLLNTKYFASFLLIIILEKVLDKL